MLDFGSPGVDSSLSHFTIDGPFVELGSAPATTFHPGLGNIWPKFPTSISKSSWELWYFDGFSEEDRSAIVVGVNRSAEGRKHGGFKVQIFAIWPDKTTWHRDLYFPESLILTERGSGDVLGLWQDASKTSSISFRVPEDQSRAELIFSVPNVVQGSMCLTTLPGDTGLYSRADMGPVACHMRPIARVSVTADITIHVEGSAPPRQLTLGPSGCVARGGVDRSWTALSWPQFMTESYFLHAVAGPYSMQIMYIVSDVAGGTIPYTTSRLYHEGNLVCVAQTVVDIASDNVLQDSLVLSKRYGEPGTSWLTGAFRDQNIGYDVEFVQGGENAQRWKFRVRHDRALWNKRTSAPGPNSTGNSGFVEAVVGGMVDREYHGVGTGGQCELSPV